MKYPVEYRVGGSTYELDAYDERVCLYRRKEDGWYVVWSNYGRDDEPDFRAGFYTPNYGEAFAECLRRSK